MSMVPLKRHTSASATCWRFAPAICKGIAQAVDLGGGSWNQERDGDTETQSLYRFGPPERNILCPVSVVLYVLRWMGVQAGVP
jgi:hypothetical protein